MSSKGMEPKHEEKKLTREEFDKLTAEIHAIIGDKLKGHKDGDAERLLFENYRRRKRKGSSHASH